MATWDDVRRICLALPETQQRSTPEGRPSEWRVRDKLYAWDRPLRKADLEALGESTPTGPILGVRVTDLDAREMLLAEQPGTYFTTPHFDGYPAILVQLETVGVGDLEELLLEGWLRQAPKRLAAAYLAGLG